MANSPDDGFVRGFYLGLGFWTAGFLIGTVVFILGVFIVGGVASKQAKLPRTIDVDSRD